MAVVEAEHVSKTFGSVQVLRDVSLTVEAGSVHALLGENGSGKSTLIKVLSGFYSPDAGATVRVGGQDLVGGSPSASAAAGLRFVHQNLGVIDELTVLENLRLTSDLRRGALGLTGSTHDRDVRGLLDRIGVTLDLDAQVGTLSPVQRTAVAIARALDDSQGAMTMLVLDEPTAAMSPTEVEGLFSIVRDISAADVAVLYISHRLDEILRLADTATVLRDGVVQGSFSTAAVSRGELVSRILGTELAVAEADFADRASSARAGDVRLDVRAVHGRFLAGVGFDVRAGEIVGVAGLDGSGRDELACVLGGDHGELDATTPHATLQGPVSPRRSRAAGIGLVLPNTDPRSSVATMTVRENICLPNADLLSPRGLLRRGAEGRTSTRWLDALDVRPRRDDLELRQLSGGNRQKVVLARTLEHEPAVLVLDDPTSGVDVGARRAIYDMIRARADEGVAVLLCSSDIEDLVSVCDRVLCLVAGRVVAELERADLTEEIVLDHIVRESANSREVVAS